MFRIEQVDNTIENSSLDELVSEVNGIASNVAECPDDVVLDLVDTILIEEAVELGKTLA